MGDPGRAKNESGDGFFRPRSRTECCNGTFPRQDCFCGGAGVEGRTPGEKGPSGLNLPYPYPAPPLAGEKLPLSASSSQGTGSLLISSCGGVRNEDLLGGDNLASRSPQSEGEPHPPSTSKGRDIPPWSSEAGLRLDSSGKSGSSFQQWGEKLEFPEVPTASEQRACLGSDSFFSKTWGPGSPGSCLGSRQMRDRESGDEFPYLPLLGPIKSDGRGGNGADLLPRFLLEM